MHYALLDIPQLGHDLAIAQALNANHISLYRGPEDPQMAEMAPMLFWYEPGGAFAEWLDQHWGEARGISLITTASPEEIRKHLRRFLRIKTDDGRQLYFRFYDPRVLRVFLPTCDASQLLEFFGPVDQFYVEDLDHQQTLYFAHKDGQLLTDERRMAR
ncbi:MAG: DUF4123 domain-containing protein [Bacteroidetes bacterium]|nr:DUF4123 domain-containing protein [Fibrella sp.]